MLRISKLADYATVLMTYLARHKEDLNNATLVAQGTGISVPTVKKLLKLLTQSGLLISQRGTKGGYFLARAADQISVLEIIESIDTQTNITECSDNHSHCSLEAVCDVKSNWLVINKAIQAALASVMLSHLAQSKLSIRTVDTSKLQAIRGENHGKSTTE